MNESQNLKLAETDHSDAFVFTPYPTDEPEFSNRSTRMIGTEAKLLIPANPKTTP